MRNILITFLTCLVGFTAHAQTVSGVVIDSVTNKPLERSSVTAYSLPARKLLKFTFTDASGRFSLVVPDGVSDSLLVTVKYLGYRAASKSITANTQSANFALTPETFVLNEVEIKPLAVKQEGDTLTFNTLKFEKGNDNTLADVLKRLPGVEVSSEGKISYNGQQINKFYIEGLDLLDGKYDLATNNMAKQDVAEVNIFKNHQPIRALQDSEFSESPAMNIKLSKKNVLIGSGQVGVSPNLKMGDVNFSPLFFSEKTQLLSTSQFNNSGKDLVRQFRSFDVNALTFLEKIPDNKRGLLSYTNRPAPSFDNERLRFNKTFAQSFNLLRKLPKDFQIKTNIHGYINQENNIYNYLTQFYLADSENLNRNGMQSLRQNLKTLEGTVDVEKNTKKLYFKNQVAFAVNRDDSGGENNEADLPPSSVNLNGSYDSFSNTLYAVVPLKKQRSLSIYSLTSYSNQAQLTDNSPLPNFLDTLQVSSLRLLQNYTNAKLFTLNALSYTIGKQKLKLLNRITWAYDRDLFNSNIVLQPEEITLGNEFANDMRWQKNNLEYFSELNYTTSNYNLRGRLAVNDYRFDVTERFNDLDFNRSDVVLNPSVYFFSKFQSKLNFELSFIKRNDFGNVRSIYLGYILLRSSVITRNAGQLGAYEQLSFNGRLKYADILNSFYANAGFALSRNTNDLLTSTQFSEVGNLEDITIEQENKSEQFQFFSTVEKNFYKLKMDVKLKTFFNVDRQNVLINSQLSDVVQNNFVGNLLVTKEIGKLVYVDYVFTLNQSNSEFSGNAAPYNFTTTAQTLGVNYVLPEKFSLRLNNSYSTFDYTAQKFDYFFTDLRLTVPTKNDKLSLEMEWQNVLNAKQYFILDRSNSFQTVSVLPFRSSQVLIFLRFRL
ncbi:MAG: hypothetical protein ACI9V1_002070 [Spirosomataceae bacterium]